MDNKTYIQKYMDDVSWVARTVSLPDIEKVIDILFEAWRQDKQVFTWGMVVPHQRLLISPATWQRQLGRRGKDPFGLNA
jgi:hypothetical protein